MRLKTERSETVIFRQYMKPNPRGEGPSWKAVEVDLAAYAGQQGELVLNCSNDRGKTTIADWLNWRDIAVETRPNLSAGSE